MMSKNVYLLSLGVQTMGCSDDKALADQASSTQPLHVVAVAKSKSRLEQDAIETCNQN